MGATRYASVLGLGFGDCGKGHFIDALTRRWTAHTVVRFQGGAQAGHNVVTSGERGAPGRHHTFSQFGAGTFVPGTRTLLLDPMVVHPTALLVEAEALGRVGVHDALGRLSIDARCRVTTPYHQAAGRLRERLRGAAAHGTCGVGFGETIAHSLAHPDQVLHYADLFPSTGSQLRTQLTRLQAIRETLLAELAPLCPSGSPTADFDEIRQLRDETLARHWLPMAQAVARHCSPASADQIHTQLRQPGCVLFEGAQGVLLDEWRGFHPHTTWSTISTAAVERVTARFGITAPVEHYGVLRTYLTRHGPGPLPTHDPELDTQLPEPHNRTAGWQGPFRRGHPDAVLLRYALDSVGPLTGLLITHLDVFARNVALKWCTHYTAKSSAIERLPLATSQDLAHQSSLTALLLSAAPHYTPTPITSGKAFLAHLTELTSLPILLQSHGPTEDHIRHE
jgi:adenylosuccinate synthase